MYSVLPSFIFGFHGCDKSVAEEVFAGNQELKHSNNDYDWLGNGVYFWENNPQRALDFATQATVNPKLTRDKVTTPAVVGAIIDLGHCFNLLDSKFIDFIDVGHKILHKELTDQGLPIPKNSVCSDSGDFMLRRLDCAVIEAVYQKQDWLVENGEADYKFDTTRGVFIEGKEVYPTAGFRTKNHIQICVKNHDCIKGYFRVKS